MWVLQTGLWIVGITICAIAAKRSRARRSIRASGLGKSGMNRREEVNLALAEIIQAWNQKRDGDLVELARRLNTIAARVEAGKSAA